MSLAGDSLERKENGVEVKGARPELCFLRFTALPSLSSNPLPPAPLHTPTDDFTSYVTKKQKPADFLPLN